jgi:hypothetical protein
MCVGVLSTGFYFFARWIRSVYIRFEKIYALDI